VILQWFLRGHQISPVTGQPLRSRDLVPNIALARVIEAFLKSNRQHR
jgi:hypothetical protein